MRIAYVIPTYPLPSQTFIVNEMIEVQEAGHDIVAVPLYLAAPSSVRNDTFEQLRPVAILPAPLVSFTVACLALWMLFTRPLRVMGTLISLHWASGLNPYAHASLIVITPKALATARRLRQAKVDRIHAHFATHTATCAGIAGRVSDIPFSFTAHAYDIYCTTPKLRNDTLDWKLRRAIQVFTVCEYAASLLRQRLPGADGDRIHTAYVGIPMHLFCEEPPPPRDGGLRLLCVAHFYEKKGLDTLIDACALLRDQGLPFHLRLYGDGPLREALAAQIARLRLGGHVTLGGIIPQEEVARQMKACHFLVMPCRQGRDGDMDGIPTAFMEAMAVGRPVISCPISGIPELVRHGETGLLVPPNDPSALAAAVMRLACDNALCIRLGQQARALAERQHDQRLNACRLLELTTRGSLSSFARQQTQNTF
jgi:colanic acid/amylovoran biosynthesis glycosyltransferase